MNVSAATTGIKEYFTLSLQLKLIVLHLLLFGRGDMKTSICYLNYR
jgi:hypothetical protein